MLLFAVSCSKRNLWNEIEGSDHYSRAMQSWNILLSLSGFAYDGPAGKIGFAPRLTPENSNVSFRPLKPGENISQEQTNDFQKETIDVKWGRLHLSRLSFVIAENLKAPAVKVSIDGRPVLSTHIMLNGKIVIALDPQPTLGAGQRMEILMK